MQIHHINSYEYIQPEFMAVLVTVNGYDNIENQIYHTLLVNRFIYTQLIVNFPIGRFINKFDIINTLFY